MRCPYAVILSSVFQNLEKWESLCGPLQDPEQIQNLIIIICREDSIYYPLLYHFMVGADFFEREIQPILKKNANAKLITIPIELKKGFDGDPFEKHFSPSVWPRLNQGRSKHSGRLYHQCIEKVKIPKQIGAVVENIPWYVNNYPEEFRQIHYRHYVSA